MRTYSVTIGKPIVSFYTGTIRYLVTLHQHTDCDTVLETHYAIGSRRARIIAEHMQTEIYVHASNNCPIHDNSQDI